MLPNKCVQYAVIDYIHCCLSETSKLLKHVIVHTFNQKSKESQRKFYLIGYKPRNNGHSQRKIYGNPSIKEEGSDIKWQLKNLRWHMEEYAEHMNVYEDVLDDITGFLLFEVVHHCYLGSQKLSDSLSDKQFLYDCIDACKELNSAIQESSFFSNIHEIAVATCGKINLLSSAASEFQNCSKCYIEIDSTRDFLLKELQMKADADKLHISTEDSDDIFMSDVSMISTHKSGCVSSLNSSPMDSSMVIVDTPVIHNKTISMLKKSELRNSKIKKSDNVDEIDGSFVLI